MRRNGQRASRRDDRREAREEPRSSARQISRENTPDSPVVVHLQRQLANAFLLYANYKRYHWQCYGPLFRDLHRLFDELAQEVQATIDELAERVRMIGQDPIAMPAEVMEATSIKPARLGQSMREMAEEANAHVVRVIREMREAVDAADEARDPGTADLFTRFVQVHEKHEWFLRDLLERDDGLVS
jgi:starvation-inducible DNA-binding protein